METAVPRPGLMIVRAGVPMRVKGITPIDPNTGRRTVHTDDNPPYFTVKEGEEVMVCGYGEVSVDRP